MLAITLSIIALCWAYVFLWSIRESRNKARESLKSKAVLKGQVFILTGASRGIGEQLAYKLSEQQATLMLPVRDVSKAASIVKKCEELGGKVHTIKYDAADRDSCVKLVEETVALEGRLDGIVLNHATSCFEPLFAMSADDQEKLIRSTMESNYFGYVNITLAGLPHLQKTGAAFNKHGRLVVVGSLAGRVATPYVHAYSASKHAIDGFFNCLRHELALLPDNKVVMTNCLLGAIGTQNFYDITTPQSKSVQTMAVTPEATAQRIIEGFIGEEEQFYFPAIIQAQYVINSISHRMAFKVVRMAHGLN
ncbi:hypothetical protein HDU79_005454 [Rhizoclosmatium sp. JEL0117]|nr:hypothetical protein HDU79_005454 [Rhizoclosmatium sp. JEL0117]